MARQLNDKVIIFEIVPFKRIQSTQKSLSTLKDFLVHGPRFYHA